MRFQVLTPVEVRVVSALAHAMFPGNAGLPTAAEARVVEYIDTYLTWLPANDRRLVRLMLAAFGAGIATQPRDKRAAWIGSWENSRLYPRRVIFQALRSVFTLGYCADPEVLRRMGVECGTEILRRQADARAQALAQSSVASFDEVAIPAAANSAVVAPSQKNHDKSRSRKPARLRAVRAEATEAISQ